MGNDRNSLLSEIEKVLEIYPDIRLGELLSKAIEPGEDLRYIDDEDLRQRVKHTIGTCGVRMAEEIINKEIYDVSHKPLK